MTFILSYREVLKNESLRNWDRIVVVLKPSILYDIDQLPNKIKSL